MTESKSEEKEQKEEKRSEPRVAYTVFPFNTNRALERLICMHPHSRTVMTLVS
jgi:hypothetical protein